MDGILIESERIHKLQDNPTLKRQHQMAALGDSKRAVPRQKLNPGSPLPELGRNSKGNHGMKMICHSNF